jgi:GTP cyclohydrolase III
MLNKPYVVINQLIKAIGKIAHLNNSLTYMLGGENINSIKNDHQDRDFLKIKFK